MCLFLISPPKLKRPFPFCIPPLTIKAMSHPRCLVNLPPKRAARMQIDHCGGLTMRVGIGGADDPTRVPLVPYIADTHPGGGGGGRDRFRVRKTNISMPLPTFTHFWTPPRRKVRLTVKHCIPKVADPDLIVESSEGALGLHSGDMVRSLSPSPRISSPRGLSLL